MVFLPMSRLMKDYRFLQVDRDVCNVAKVKEFHCTDLNVDKLYH